MMKNKGEIISLKLIESLIEKKRKKNGKRRQKMKEDNFMKTQRQKKD